MGMEANEYKDFIRKYFPYSSIYDDCNIGLLYSRVCENNLVTDIYEKYISDNEAISCHLIFLQRYKKHFNKLLLYIPLNDVFGINFCMRSAIENLLKFFYSIYFDDESDDVSKLSFRHIKEKFNKLETKIFMDKRKLNTIFNYYGKFSNSIHSKVDKEQSELEYIESIIKTKDINLNNLDCKLLKILDIYEILICNIFQFNYKTFSVGETVRLKNNLSPKRFQKIKKYIE